MRTKLVLICVLIVLSTCCACGKSLYSKQETAGLEVNQVEAQDEIRLISIKSPVRQGDICMLTIEGKAGMSYSASCTYKMGDIPESVTQTKVAGSDGRVAWAWFVKPVTNPGTYTVTVSGGGKTLTTSYTVIKQ